MLAASFPSRLRGTELREVAPEVLDQLLTTAEAATLAGVSVHTVRQWVSRGHLLVADRDARGRPLYRWIDVAKAERFTRDARKKYMTAA